MSTEECTCVDNASLVDNAPICVCDGGYTQDSGVCVQDPTSTTTTSTSTTTTEISCTAGMVNNVNGDCIPCVGSIESPLTTEICQCSDRLSELHFKLYDSKIV